MLAHRVIVAVCTFAICRAVDLPAQQDALPGLGAGDDSERMLTIDHYVPVRSLVPAIEGQIAQIYVRERAKAGVVLRRPGVAAPVVLFVHGAGTPAEVAFDVPFEDYSWMTFLAQSGFDVFSMEMTGYGRSTRPLAMNDPCNLSEQQQAAVAFGANSAPCDPSYPHQLTTIESDWNDLGAVVDHLRVLRGVERVSLVAWSLGGARAGGYAAQHPDRIDRMVLLAPVYPATAAARPTNLPASGLPMTMQTYDAFVANWDRQAGCPAQYDPAAREAVWSKMLQADPIGATWGPGVRRAPSVTTWGWGPSMAERVMTPTLIVAGVHDAQIAPARPRQLYLDLGAAEKVFVDLGCASHNAMWETNHLVLFNASLEWLAQGSVNGARDGELRLGY